MSESYEMRGQPVAPGIATGPAFLLRRQRQEIAPRSIREDEVNAELQRLDDALYLTRLDLRQHRRKAKRSFGSIVARIFDAHLLFLEDEVTFDQIRDAIRTEKLSADYSLWRILEHFARSFEEQDEDIFRDRAQDVRDVCSRMIAHLTGRKPESVGAIEKPSILIASELGPSDVLQLDPAQVLAVATEAGGSTSHTAILTRSLGVPSVVGLSDMMEFVEDDDLVIINGNSGKVFVRPSEKKLASYRRKESIYRDFLASLDNLRERAAETTDGRLIQLHANIELPDEARRLPRYGADGVGLFRTEYLVLASGGLPDEELQVQEYNRVVKHLQGKPLTLRSFDLGGDKAFPGAGIPPQANPFMGWRALRVALDRPEMLMPQLRAALRASASGPVRLMFPMIGNIEELQAALHQLDEAREQLRDKGIAFDPEMQVGMMVEVPSAALEAANYAPLVDFFSIGTNDLAQFTLAVDRSNELVARWHDPCHPAVLHLIENTVKAAREAGIEVGLCGELAGEPVATLLLVGLGLDELSLSPAMIPEVKKLIVSASEVEARKIAEEALSLHSALQVRSLLYDTMKHRFSDLPIWFERNGL